MFKTLITLLIGMTLIGCSGNSPVYVENNETIYYKNSKVCYLVGSTAYFITLQEDVEEGQYVAFAKTENGETISANVNWILEDYKYCVK